jgi:hypothetical protein
MQEQRKEGGKAAEGDAAVAETVRDQQHTGNHGKPGEEAHGSDRRGGTRAGAENVEPTEKT